MTASRKLMRRPEREQSILDAAARAFARRGFAATSMEDIAAEAGITKLIVYRHFDSKRDLYEAVLDRTRTRLREATGGPERLNWESVEGMLRAAWEDPSGFRLLFEYAAREPEFAHYSEQFTERALDVAEEVLAGDIPDLTLRRWTARVILAMVREAIIAWLQVGERERDEEMLVRLRQALGAM